MSVKASVSITKTQEEFARDLVAQGRYPSLSAVMQQGLELLRERTEQKSAEIEALRALLEERRNGSFVSVEDGRSRTKAMLERKKRAHGIPG